MAGSGHPPGERRTHAGGGRAMRLLAGLALFCLAFQAGAAPLENRLAGNPSPYLALHGADPVHWQPWGPAVLERARRENKPVFVSSGYFSCHWCHVMQRESYRNPGIAALLNRHFIPVKIDRELRPALDGHLIEFVRRTRGNAGWPLNVFLTPEGYPLFGLTYSPPEAFETLLTRLAALWERSGTELAADARNALAAWAGEQSVEPFAGPMDAGALSDALTAMALSLGDSLEGGFGLQNRFPMSPQWRVLLDRAGDDGALRQLVELTLDQMATQGMRDHIGGGFFRYTVDPAWQVPHFEKMLYNQAGLARLYLKAARVLGRDDYRAVAADTLAFAVRALQEADGGFISSLSAVDPRDVEGGGYLWSEAELAASLDPEELAFARKRWRLAAPPALDEGHLPVDHRSPGQLAEESGGEAAELRALEARVRAKLAAAKRERSHPRDHKKLAAWNGLMLSALAEGARVLDEPGLEAAGRRLRDYLVDRLLAGGTLSRALGPEGAIGSAGLEDYAYVAAGLRDWGLHRGSPEDLRIAEGLVREAWKRFFTDEGWLTGEGMLIPGIAREAAVTDGALPSASAIVIRLTLESRPPELDDEAERALRIAYRPALEAPLWHASYVPVFAEWARLKSAGNPGSAVPHAGAVEQ